MNDIQRTRDFIIFRNESVLQDQKQNKHYIDNKKPLI